MPKYKSSRKRRKGKIKFSQRVGLRRKDEAPKDTLKKAPTRVPNNGATFKVKIRKRND